MTDLIERINQYYFGSNEVELKPDFRIASRVNKGIITSFEIEEGDDMLVYVVKTDVGYIFNAQGNTYSVNDIDAIINNKDSAESFQSSLVMSAYEIQCINVLRYLYSIINPIMEQLPLLKLKQYITIYNIILEIDPND